MRTTYADGRTFLTARDVLEIDPMNPARVPLETICRRLGCGKNRARELRALATRAPSVLVVQHPGRREAA